MNRKFERTWDELDDECKEQTREEYIINLQNEGQDIDIYTEVPTETLADAYSGYFFVPEDFGQETWGDEDNAAEGSAK